MIRRRSLAGGLAATVVLVLASTAPLRAEIIVSFDSPDAFVPAFGERQVKVAVAADEPIARVVFYVDGLVIGEREAPPWTVTAQLGEENREHRFEVIAYGASGASGSQTLLTPRVRVDEEVTLELQQLYVTVARGDRRVLHLDAGDFAVDDAGRRQRLVTFARGDIPFTAAVLVDASSSMQGPKLRAALAGARSFFERMRPLDEGRLMVFSDRLLHLTPPTTFAAVLTAGLAGVRADGGTALSDFLYMALKQLEERQGRRVVILLSDGVDSHSVLTMDDVLAQARRSQALVYWLRLPYRDDDPDAAMPRLASAWRSSEEYVAQRQRLEEAIVESGGRSLALRSLADIEPAFRGILDELRDQYVLGYYPERRHDGRWRKVRVGVDDPTLQVRAREGYLDF